MGATARTAATARTGAMAHTGAGKTPTKRRPYLTPPASASKERVLRSADTMSGWLELTADYRCNNRCVGCYAVLDEGPRMPTSEAFHVIRVGFDEGARRLWLGGGEPTLRADLFHLVKEARRLGYERVK